LIEATRTSFLFAKFWTPIRLHCFMLVAIVLSLLICTSHDEAGKQNEAD